MDKELLYRFFNKETTFEEEKQIRQWIESSEVNREELFRERAFFDACLLHADVAEEEAAGQTDNKSHYRKLFRNVIVGISSVAAVICLTITGTVKYVEQALRNTPDNVINVPQGQRVNLILADGSKVWLNSNTHMTYPQTFQGADKRMVRIDGEGYFEVTKDRKKPFIVNTSRGKVEVLGTKFYITAYGQVEQFETSLIEGLVKVSTPSSELLLGPNDKAVLENGHLVKKSIDDMSVYRWREGLYCFTNTSFDKVLEQFELYFDVKFVKQNSRLRNPHISGKFRLVDGVDYALKILQKEVKFTYKRDEMTNFIYLK